MALGADRYGSRADTLVFLGCLALSVAALSLPASWRDPIAASLRQTVLAPLLGLQLRSQDLQAWRGRYEAVQAERDSAALAAAFLPELRNENARLRELLGLAQRLSWGYVAAEVLHQAEPTDPVILLVSAGRAARVEPLSAVVSPEGLVGVVTKVDAATSVVLSWAHPDFRASAMAADGSVYGIVAPAGATGPRSWLLELRGVPYRQRVPEGTLILTSGRGGVLPRGIPLGQVIGVSGQAEGWETTYLVRPAVHPAAISHVLVLSPQWTTGDTGPAFRPGTRGPTP
ncbi:MAG: rod shape-determining protein MreC [Gemmatimonadales bacterium]